MRKKSLGVVIGRFQCDALHDGHIWLLDTVSELHDDLLVFVGDRKSPPTATNPLSFEIRQAMILEDYPEAHVMALMDHPSNTEWSRRLDNMLRLFKEGARYDEITLYCGRDGFARHYSGIFPVTVFDPGELGRFDLDDVSATKMREEVAGMSVNWEDGDIAQNELAFFRKGIIYAMMHLPHRIYLTVDIACTRGENGDMEICMGQREWETEQWRLPGGFVESDESFKAAARREYQEETSAWIEGVSIVGDFPVNDWRLRGATGVSHKTILCHGSGWGNIQANDDIFRTKWIHMSLLISNPALIVKEHHDMFMKGLVPYLQSKGLL